MVRGKILIVEDDKYIREGLREVLLTNGYDFFEAADGLQAMAEFEKTAMNLIILDINLGKDNGYDVCERIRKESMVPILFLTARNNEEEIIKGLRLGGDDYITKPFRMNELLARCEALIRRGMYFDKRLIYSDKLSLDISTGDLYFEGKNIELSLNEKKIVRILMEYWPQTVKRGELMKYVWEQQCIDDNILNVCVSRSREKIDCATGKNYIETVRGIGYRWCFPVQR